MVKRPKSSQTCEKAVLLVENIFNEGNWLCNRLSLDFGIDLHVRIFESANCRKGMPWEVHVQVKGTEKIRISQNHVKFAIDTDHLRDWYSAALPVLFVICDINESKVYWLWIKDYVESIDSCWQDNKTHTLSIPVTNRLTPLILPNLLADVKRNAFYREAPNIISSLEGNHSDCDSQQYSYSKQYSQPISRPDDSVQHPALAVCIYCHNFFWIEESVTSGWDTYFDGDDIPLNVTFQKIYWPWEHQPAVYVCDFPGEHCPVCTSGKGPLITCASCGTYHYPLDDCLDPDEWDDPRMSYEEAIELCTLCFDELRDKRQLKSSR